MTWHVETSVLVRRLPLAEDELLRQVRAAVQAAAAECGKAAPSLSVAIVGDRRMRRLNRDFHQSDRTTDVLAFPLDDPLDPVGVSGEIIVCAPEAYRQARRHGLDAATELLLYVVHGTLHLLGEDDHTPFDAKRMRRLERAALLRLGHRLPDAHLEEIKPT